MIFRAGDLFALLAIGFLAVILSRCDPPRKPGRSHVEISEFSAQAYRSARSRKRSHWIKQKRRHDRPRIAGKRASDRLIENRPASSVKQSGVVKHDGQGQCAAIGTDREVAAARCRLQEGLAIMEAPQREAKEQTAKPLAVPDSPPIADPWPVRAVPVIKINREDWHGSRPVSSPSPAARSCLWEAPAAWVAALWGAVTFACLGAIVFFSRGRGPEYKHIRRSKIRTRIAERLGERAVRLALLTPHPMDDIR